MVNSYIKRYIEETVKKDLPKKMVFISGPRQAGKTTLAKHILQQEMGADAEKFYLSWDSAEDREKIIREQFPAGQGVIVLDEIHKFSRWRQVVKGLFDKRKHELKILVTGSGRLDYYRRGGDSLQGRYHLFRLYPFTFAEVFPFRNDALTLLLKYGGFPEPFLAESEREARRWSREYRTGIIYDDLNSLENVRDLSLLEQLAFRLPLIVGSPLSINALREDLQVSHQTVARWLEMLENLYLLFRIYPFGPPKIRAIKKEAKHYHFDLMLIEDEGARFENLIAIHLIKWVHFQQDYEGFETELRYFRTREGREVDFVVLRNGKPTLFVECKLRTREVSPALRYLKKRFPEADSVQVTRYQEEDLLTREGIRICSPQDFLKNLI